MYLFTRYAQLEYTIELSLEAFKATVAWWGRTQFIHERQNLRKFWQEGELGFQTDFILQILEMY